jgi:hypothetical protein
LILIFTDGEEPAPRYGSSAFVERHPWAREIGAVINLEAVGGTGPSILTATSGPERGLIDSYAVAAPWPVAYSYLPALARLIGGSISDFDTYRASGIPGIELAWLHGSPIYHTPADTPGSVDPASLYQQGANTLAMVRHLASIDLTSELAPGAAVFFTLGRFVVVRHPAEWIAPIALVAGIALAWAWRRRRVGMGHVVRGLARTSLVAMGSAVLGALVWAGIAAARPMLSVVEAYVALAGLLLMAAGTAALSRRLPLLSPRPEPFAVTGIWLTLAAVTALAAPELGYFFAWTALAAAGVLLAGTWRPVGGSRWAGLVGFAAVATTAVVLLVPPIDTFFQLAQPRPGNPDSQLVPFVAIPVALATLVLELSRAFRADDGQPSPFGRATTLR